MKIGVLIAVSILFSLNVAILTSNAVSPGSLNLTAQESYNDQYLEHHYLKNVWCIAFNVKFDIEWTKKWYGHDLVITVEDGDLDLNGNKKKCKEVTQDIYCNVKEATGCLLSEDEGDDSSE